MSEKIEEKPGQFMDNDMEKRMSETLSLLNDPGDNIDLLSEITPEARLPMVRMYYKAHLFGNKDLFWTLDKYLRLGVSLDRKGRIEITDVLKSFYQNIKDVASSLRDTVKEHT